MTLKEYIDPFTGEPAKPVVMIEISFRLQLPK